MALTRRKKTEVRRNGWETKEINKIQAVGICVWVEGRGEGKPGGVGKGNFLMASNNIFPWRAIKANDKCVFPPTTSDFIAIFTTIGIRAWGRGCGGRGREEREW